MNELQKSYYQEMLQNDRLIPLTLDNRTCGLITYILCNDMKDVENKDPWQIRRDIPEGDIVYIEQLIVKTSLTMQDFLRIFDCLMRIIREKHPNVSKIFWKRYNYRTHKTNLRIYNLNKEPNYVYN